MPFVSLPRLLLREIVPFLNKVTVRERSIADSSPTLADPRRPSPTLCTLCTPTFFHFPSPYEAGGIRYPLYVCATNGTNAGCWQEFDSDRLSEDDRKFSEDDRKLSEDDHLDLDRLREQQEFCSRESRLKWQLQLHREQKHLQEQVATFFFAWFDA